uniref:GDSL esterase/lipase n=1 Tax=Aegilops tauschii TaxID=37682 RepID=N1QQB8_AEGTA
MAVASVIACCSLVIMALMAAAATAGSVPAVYVFGDSLADVGNNNHLLTLLKADFSHNGMDYAGGKATGRFSNGKNSADFLADKLGLATSPPYLALSSSSNANYVNGVSFASGGAGVSNATNKNQCITFDKQIEYYSGVYSSLARSLGQAQAATHLARSIFAITIGSNDIIHYAKANNAATPSQQQQYVDALIQSLSGQLQSLYNLGARKVLFLGTGPVGCTPSLREMSSAKAKAACCGLGDMNAKIACTPLSSYCANRSDHVFWDFYHPTEATAQKLTATAFDGSAPFIFPINVRQLSAI